MTNESHVYMPILDDRRLDDELAEARRVLRRWQEKFASGNDNPVRSRHITAIDIDVRDTEAFFERWPIISDHQQAQQVAALERENKRLENQAQQSWDERVLYLDHLRNLLARIHRDGGHYVEEHGLEKAVKDAHEVWADLRLKSEALAAISGKETT